MKKIIKSRKLRHGSVSAALTLLVIAAAVIINAAVSALGARFSWYVDMSSAFSTELSEECADYIRDFIIPDIKKLGPQKAEIIFCSPEKEIKDEPSLYYILSTARAIEEKYPEYISVEFLDVWRNPQTARELGAQSSSDVIISHGKKHAAIRLVDFYVFDSEDESAPIAYNGEKRLSSGLMKVTQKDAGICYLTVNHGETVKDRELMYMLADAGYSYSYLDLLNQDIPEDCALLVTYAPLRDLTEKGDISEAARLDEYLSGGGKYMFFASADTFVSGSHKNFESLLGRWGVKYAHETSEDGVELCQNIKDSAHSLTTDGYTVLSENAVNSHAANILAGLEKPNVFANSTAILPAEGFVSRNDGTFSDKNSGTKRLIPLLASHSSAEAWAGGRIVAKAEKSPFTLMSLTVDEGGNGQGGCLLACASTEFCSESSMQSAVFGNSQTLSAVIKYMGKDNVPVALSFKPFGVTDIESLTTSDAKTATALLVILPTLTAAVVGTVILVRRKNRL